MILTQLEETLREQTRLAEILAELRLTRALRGDLREKLERRLAHNPFSLLERHYPHCLAAHLVAEGIYGYHEGTYWSTVVRADTGPRQRRWGRFFEGFVRKRGLARFEARRRSHRYVSLILLHGGIPNASLPGFFEHCLHYTLRHPELLEYPARQLIEVWLRRSTTRYHLNKPALHFLEQGGDVAVDFADRCVEVADTWARTQTILDAQAAGLPRRVVEAYEAWVTQQDAPPAPGPGATPTRTTVQAPQLQIDPWGAGPVLHLPAQQIPGDQAPSCEWTIAEAADETQLPVHTSRARGGWRSDPARVPLEGPARDYVVRYTDGCGRTRQWRFEGPRPEAPLMAFDGESGELLPQGPALPQMPVWVVRPREATWEAEGGRRLDTGVPLPAGWSDYVAERWDLSSVTTVGVGDQRLPVRRNAYSMRPRLTGGERLDALPGLDQTYAALPTLVIPVPEEREIDLEAQRWQVRVSRDAAEGGAAQHGAPPQALATLNPRLDAAARTLHLPLDRLIGEREIGTYTLHLRGPLGRSARFSLRYLTRITVYGHDPVRVPVGGIWPARELRLRTAAALTVRSDDPDVTVTPDTTTAYRVTVPEGRTIAHLELAASATGHAAAVEVAAPGLQWTLEEDGHPGPWHTCPLSRPKEWLRHASAASLVVATAPADARTPLQGHLTVGPEDEATQQLPSRSRTGHELRFNLREATGAADARAPYVPFMLRLEGHTGAVPVFRLTEALDVEGLSLRSSRHGDRWDLTVAWTTRGRPLRDRHALLWSLGRPWEEPLSLPIPDEAAGAHSASRDVERLAPGPYRLEMALVDPWRHERPVRPSAGAPNTSEVWIGTELEYEEYLDARTDEAAAHLERAFATETRSPEQCRESLQALDEAFGPEHVGILLDTVDSLTGRGDVVAALSDRQRPALHFAPDLLRRHPATLLQQVAARSARADASGRARLRQLLIGLGVFDKVAASPSLLGALDGQSVERLWALWGPLGFLLEAHGAGDEVGWQARAERTTGLGEVTAPEPEAEGRVEGAEAAAPGEDGGETSGDGSPADGALAVGRSLLRLTQAPSRYGVIGAQDLLLFELPAAQLTAMQTQLQLAPRGLLDAGSWLAFNLRWLAAAKGEGEPAASRRAREQLLGHPNPLRAALGRLQDGPAPAQAVAALCLERYDPYARHPLVNFPFAVGATALLLRALAHWPGALDELRHHRQTYRMLAVAALESAPDLFARDLCLSELAIAQEVTLQATLEADRDPEAAQPSSPPA